MSSTQFAYRIPHDSNLNYLPLVYFLPQELICRFPTLSKIPRCMGVLAKSERFIDLLTGDDFLSQIIDAVAILAFPHFGFGGRKEDYTGYCPVWMFPNVISLWAKLLEEETGWGLQRLFTIPSTDVIPFFDTVYIKDIMKRIVKRGITEQNWQSILDVVKEMPCDEDFEKHKSKVRIDFYRKWYHTRSKKVKMVSLEECLENNDEHGVLYVEDKSARFEDNVVAEDYYQAFKARLSDKDMKILELRVMGLTYEEIAERMGYSNHSGVIKRMRAITKEFEKYEEQQ